MDAPVERAVREFWDAGLPEVRDRDIDAHLNEPLITDIVGPRRAGKTFLMFSLIRKLRERTPKETTLYLNFENRHLFPVGGEQLNEVVQFIHAEGLLEKFGKVYLFLDEVQRIAGWERYIRSIHDEFRGRIKVFVSGSSANLLSREYARLLTGRHLTATVLPLSFAEFLRFNGVRCEIRAMTERTGAQVKRQLKDYLLHGGFPEVVLGRDRPAMLSQLFNDIVSRDITSRAGVRHGNVLEEFSGFLARNVGNLLSFGKMARYFRSRGIKVSVPTLIRYFAMMKDAFLFFDNTIFSYSIRDRMQYPRKIYSVDNGIANAAGDAGMGRLCENAVAVELLRRGSRTHYWKSRDGSEVDFVVRARSTPVPLQVCYDIAAPDTKGREVRSLLKCMREFKLRRGTVITYDHEGEERFYGSRVRFVPLWKFLLGAP